MSCPSSCCSSAGSMAGVISISGNIELSQDLSRGQAEYQLSVPQYLGIVSTDSEARC